MAAQPHISAGTSFADACREVLAYLSTEVPMGLWSVTRVENGRQTFLSFADGTNLYGVPVGGGHAWDDSYCVRMVTGAAPHVAPDARSVPAYASAGVNRQLPIQAFAGMPIFEPDGSLFGTLCGIDPAVQPRAITDQLPLLTLVSSLLGIVLAAERAREEAASAVRTVQTQAHTDALTGLLNRRGWQSAVADEQARYDLFADPTVVVVVDLDDLKRVNDGPGGHAAGDGHLEAAAAALRSAVPEPGPIARLGGDEFAVILRRCDAAEAPARVAHLEQALTGAGVAASVGWAPVTVRAGLAEAISAADAAMYAVKRARRAAGRPVGSDEPGLAHDRLAVAGR